MKSHKNETARFEYVIDAAKGAMLSSVLDIDTSRLSDSLNRLTLVLDSPVLMDALGYHGTKPETAIVNVLQMATTQGAKLAIYDHIYTEVEGILQRAEESLRLGASSSSTSPGYLHFLDNGLTPVDVAIFRANLESSLIDLNIHRIETPGNYREYGLDEDRLETAIQNSVRYFQNESRTNDVKTVSAVHRMRRGDQSTTFEKSAAVLVSTNVNLIRGVKSFIRNGTFPLAISTESIASILWLRNPAMAEDVPRDIILASAYAGMQPPPILWRKYIDEVERLEERGSVSADDAIVLRSTPVGREAFMEETMGADIAEMDHLPLVILERVHTSIAKPLETQVAVLEDKLATSESLVEEASVHKSTELEKEVESPEEENRAQVEAAELRATLSDARRESAQRIARVKERSRVEISRYIKLSKCALRALLCLLFVLAIIKITYSPGYELFSIPWYLAIATILPVILSFTPLLNKAILKIEKAWTKHRTQTRLSNAGYSDAEIQLSSQEESNSSSAQ